MTANLQTSFLPNFFWSPLSPFNSHLFTPMEVLLSALCCFSFWINLFPIWSHANRMSGLRREGTSKQEGGLRNSLIGSSTNVIWNQLCMSLSPSSDKYKMSCMIVSLCFPFLYFFSFSIAWWSMITNPCCSDGGNLSFGGSERKQQKSNVLIFPFFY